MPVGLPFYNPNSTYNAPLTTPGNGSPGVPTWYDTPIVTDPGSGISANLPQGEFERYLASQGLGGFDRSSSNARAMYGRTRQGYDAAMLTNPFLSYRDYLNKEFGGFQQAFQQMTPNQRGERPQQFAGRLRIIGRG